MIEVSDIIKNCKSSTNCRLTVSCFQFVVCDAKYCTPIQHQFKLLNSLKIVTKNKDVNEPSPTEYGFKSDTYTYPIWFKYG